MSVRLDNTQVRRSSLETEAYAVIPTLDHMRWLLATPSDFDLSHDHKEPIFLFDPLLVVRNICQTLLLKVL